MPKRNKSQEVSTPSEIPPALQLTENFPVGAYVFYRDPQDNGPRFSFFSNRLLEMMDITREEIDADPMAVYRNLHPEDIGPFFEAAEEAARVKSHFFNESRYIIRGATRWYRLESVARQLPDGFTVWDGAVIDVTERRQAEDEAKTALHLTENIPVGTYVLLSPHQGPQRYTFLSKRWLEMTGLDPEKLKEDISHYFSIVHPEDREEAIAHNIAGAAALKPYKWEGRWLKDGKVTWVSIESVPRRTATGEVVWEGVFIDITARKEAEAQLLAAKEEFYRIINHLPIPVASTLHTPGLPVNFINKAFTETYGWTIEDCPTMADWARCAYPDEKYRKAVFDEFDAEVAQSVRENRPARPMEFLVTCKHGGQRNVRIDCLVAENMLFGTFLDITEQRQAEAALAAARSLEKVVEEEQRLKLSRKLKTSLKASAIAHEINQPLSRILLQSRLAASGGKTGKSALRSLIAEAETVVATIEKMKVLLRNVETTHERVNLYLVVSNSLRQLKQALSLNQIEVERQGPQRGCSVHGDAVQLQLAVMNLLRNAIEAIAEGRSQSRKISIELKKGPDSVTLAIGDSGPGWSGGPIEEALLKTSKSSGSGLGLYIVHTTMENHHGKLEVGRSPLGGAEFRMVFPSLHKGETAHRA